jgi:predicted Rossmann fold flavoprotein
MANTLIVIGGGAAGLFCAVNAARLSPTLKVVVLEKSNKLLAKVSISGGGRCNATHNCTSIATMCKMYPRGSSFVKKTFQQFFVADTLQWFTQRGVPFVAEADGRMFPVANTSQAIIDCLLNEAKQYNIEIIMQQGVTAFNAINNEFTVHTSTHKYTAQFLCVACGGFTKAEHFNWLITHGHSISAPVPSLFTFNAIDKNITQLMGLSVPNALVKINGFKQQSTGPILITHWGLSGPAVLKLSAFAAIYLHQVQYRYTAVINWCHPYTETSMLEQLKEWQQNLSHLVIANNNPLLLPNRLWLYLLQHAQINTRLTWHNIPYKSLNYLSRSLCSYNMQCQGKTTYKDEFVTAGGISLSEVNANTCESKLVTHLYFAGEVLDVDGVTGGYNFQHAWSSAYCVASGIAALQ